MGKGAPPTKGGIRGGNTGCWIIWYVVAARAAVWDEKTLNRNMKAANTPGGNVHARIRSLKLVIPAVDHYPRAAHCALYF